MSTKPTITFNDANVIPQLGFGVWQVPNGQAAKVVGTAISTGYRSIDTAAIYGNETGVGTAIAAGPVPRAELFISTKLWNDRHSMAQRAFDESLKRLRLDYIDLYLIHWPKPQQNAYVAAWQTLVKLKEEGRAKSIGVSNFTVSHLKRIIDATGVVPSVNQIELHPRFQQKELVACHAEHGIITESWSPLGQGTVLQDATLRALAQKYSKTPAQVVIRWHLDCGYIVIPKSATPSRIRENFDVFDFSLDVDDLARIAALDRKDGRVGPDPETANF
jgi:Aldo/keto reductases, related to diketogulonate reductase